MVIKLSVVAGQTDRLLAFDDGPQEYPTGLNGAVLAWCGATGCEIPAVELRRYERNGGKAFSCQLLFQRPDHAMVFKVRWY